MSRTKICAECKKSLPMIYFFVKNGVVQKVCKKCYSIKHKKSMFFTWGDRVASPSGPPSMSNPIHASANTVKKASARFQKKEGQGVIQMETRICKTCGVDFLTFGALELHQNATKHKGEIDYESRGTEAYLMGGLVGYGVYKLWKRHDDKKNKKKFGH